VLALGFHSVPLHDVVVVVRAFEAGLHLGELMLHSVQLDTSLFAGLAHFAHLLFLLPQLKIHALVLV
jgi:hypothetical protein